MRMSRNPSSLGSGISGPVAYLWSTSLVWSLRGRTHRNKTSSDEECSRSDRSEQFNFTPREVPFQEDFAILFFFD